MQGSYILLLHLPGARGIAIGSLGAIHFRKGYYAYVGSAMGGFNARLNHHLHPIKRPHWHIDYLRRRAPVTDIALCESNQRQECSIAQALARELESIAGFGASDCHCRSHLFYSEDKSKMEQVIDKALKQLKIPRRTVRATDMINAG